MVTVRCSVVDPERGAPPTDVDVSGPTGTTWGQVRADVAVTGHLPADAQLSCDEQPLRDDALLGYPPLVDGALLVAATATDALLRVRGLLELHVTGGPDCGRIHVLRPGEHRVGRAPTADVRVQDPDVSRTHLSLQVTADGVAVRDLASVNGTTVDGIPIGAETRPHPVRAGQRIRIGGSTLVLRSPGVRLASTRATGRGVVEVNRAPRATPGRQPVELRRTGLATNPPRPRLPLLAMVLPLAVAVPIALVTGQPVFLLFALMSPVMILGNAVSDRTRGLRDRRTAEHTHQEQAETFSARVASALADELAVARSQHPDPAELLRTVTRPTARLWERGPGSADVLDLALGSGQVPAGVQVRGEDGTPEPQFLDDAPVVISLRAVGNLGVAGPRHQVLAVARQLLCQVCAWHIPSLVHLVVLGGGDAWDWTRWLPHQAGRAPVLDPDDATAVVAALNDLVATRREQAGSAPSGPFTVVVVDRASSLRSLPGLADLLAHGPAVGIHALCLDDDLSGLAGECRATLDLSVGTNRLVTDALSVQPVRWDGVGVGWAEWVARSLCGLRDATPDPAATALPRDVRLLDLLDDDPTDPTQLVKGWQRFPATTSAVIGVDAEGPFELDLRRDGPHALVAGTTGAGKSELLQTLVTALAVANRPDEMSFVLVDYKGGAAFSGCVDLPHTAGLVTDLDEHLAQRALTSLGAELSHRERRLKALGCKDIEAYQAARALDPTLAPLARLAVVIDEFRLLAEELPAFVTGLVRVAAVGRSLGVHLVLATQRPAGIVSADIKANVNLRIALRVRDRADSDDVVEAPDAARIDAAAPGRAVCRTGSGGLRVVQVARVTGSTRNTDGVQIWVRPAGQRPPAAAETDDDLARIGAALRRATDLAEITPAPAAWLPPLPDSLAPDTLARGDAADGIGLGLVDLPAEQRQPVLRWHPVDDGHLGLCGGPRSGRTTALESVALGLTDSRSPDDLHLHVIDAAAGRLRALGSLPHVGTLLTRDQPHLVVRLVHRLAGEVRRRLDNRVDGPPVVLLVDGWDALVETLDGLDHGRTSEQLTALLRDGRAAGLRAVVAGERALLTSRVTSVFAERLLLRITDPTDLLLAGLPTASFSGQPLPGRGVRTSDGASVQLARVSDPLDAAVARQAAAAHQRWPVAMTTATRVVELPTSVLLDRLATVAPPGEGVLVGVGGDDARPVRLDLARHPVAVVAGPAGSGRSGALLTVARGLTGAGATVLAVCPRSSPLDAGPWPVLGPADDVLLARHLAADPQLSVLVDDVELLADTALDHVLDDLARRRGPASLMVAGTTSALLGAFRGAAATARTARTGLLLRPTSASDGEVLGVRAELADRTGPGRGLLVAAGEQQPLQVAR